MKNKAISLIGMYRNAQILLEYIALHQPKETIILSIFLDRAVLRTELTINSNLHNKI
jgi:hypothetical protein